VKTPSVVLKVTESGVDARPFVELSTVLVEQVRLYTPHGMFSADGVRFLVFVRGNNCERVNVRVVIAERHVENVIEADASRHGFQPQGVGVIGRIVRTIVHDTRMTATIRGMTTALRTW
jgi:hypothetical protein